MKRAASLLLIGSILLSACATVEPRDCSIVPPALANSFGSEDGYLAFAKTRHWPGIGDNDKISIATEYLARPDVTDAGRLYFLQNRARSYSATDKRELAIDDYKALTLLPNIASDRRAFFQGLVETSDFPMGPRPLPASTVEAQPIVRVPPIMPSAFLNGNNSGHCAMLFDVDETGKVVNAEAEYCTDESLREPSVKSIATWKYSPRKLDGNPVKAKGIKSRISFSLQDECGYHLPE